MFDSSKTSCHHYITMRTQRRQGGFTQSHRASVGPRLSSLSTWPSPMTGMGQLPTSLPGQQASSPREMENPGESTGRTRRGFVFPEALFQGNLCVIYVQEGPPDRLSSLPLTCKRLPGYCRRIRQIWSQKSVPPLTTFPTLSILFKQFKPHL